MLPVLKKPDWTVLPILAAFALSVALAPVFRAQDQGSITRVTPVPDGSLFQVDGVNYTHAVSSVWPTGSKHSLSVPTPLQFTLTPKASYTFDHWLVNGNSISLNPLAVTASPAISEYQAVFNVLYGLSVVFFNCSDASHCASPGTIVVNNAPINSSQDVYLAPGSSVTLLAIPNPGYVFVGWQPGPNQVISGFQDLVTLSAPMEVYPKFQVARPINIATVPDGLKILADHTPVIAGTTLDWGWDTVHSLGPVSPQQDNNNKYWVFQSWSDNGAANHAYTVAESNLPTTITATYIPAVPVTILTQPQGLKIKVDGVYGNILNPYFYTWGLNETHHIEAAAQQTDAQGKVWQFQSWSNGGPASQDITVPPDADLTGGIRLTATYTALTKLTVDSSLAGLKITVDGTACTTPCDVLRSSGAQVAISVPASVPQGDGSRADFNGWPNGGTSYTVTVGNSDQKVVASYHLMNRLSALTTPPNGAVYTVTPSSPDNFYDASSSVAVSLAVQPGYKFRNWLGDLSGTIPSGILAMSAPRNVTGVLDPVPYISPAGVMNAAGITPQKGVAAGSMISIFGANFATTTTVAPDGMLPQALGGVVARAGDRILPLIFTSPTQINAQLPDDFQPGDQIMTVSPPAQSDVRAVFTVVRNAPGLFPVPGNGQVLAMATHEDGSAITTDSPAAHGELITVYGTGFGPTSTPRPEGFPIPKTPDYLIVDTATVQVGDAVISPEKAFAAPGKQGVDAVQFRLGDSAPSGTIATFKVTMNGVDSNTVMLPLQ
ncbi:MAG TPA: hypothetical protein VMH28_16505 [Candidatus Acidoferrales bacterium]|nr:hypothetical protein [Candidatus Acidoferrales bacterium]